jgi:hypothetical protein
MNVSTQYDNRDRGVLFRNEQKDSETDRDYGGSLNVNGVDYWLSGWIKVSTKGTKYLSLSIKPKEQKAAQNKPAAEPKPGARNFDDPLPF